MQTTNSESFRKQEFNAPHPKLDENAGPSACVMPPNITSRPRICLASGRGCLVPRAFAIPKRTMEGRVAEV